MSGVPPGDQWGPFVGSISHGERVARLRALRAIVQLYCGTQHALVKALWLAESGEASDVEGALVELDRMPALTRRRVLGSYATHQAYKAQRDAGDSRPMPAMVEGAG